MQTFRRAIQEEIEKSGDPFLDFLEPETIVINGPENYNMDDADDFLINHDDVVVVGPSGMEPIGHGVPLTKEVTVDSDYKDSEKKEKKKGTYSYLSDDQFCKLMDITDAASKSDMFPPEIRQELLKFYVDLVKEKAERDDE